MRSSLQKGEEVLLITHTSWTAMVVPFLIALAALVASSYMEVYFSKSLHHWGWIVAALGIISFLIKYYTWKAYMWVVTNFRVIGEIGLFTHSTKESSLDKINNVTYSQSTAGRLFNYGHVEIQTATEVGATFYYNVNNPKLLRDTITLAQSQYKNLQYNNQALQMAAAINNTRVYSGPIGPGAPGIGAELEKLFELKQKGALTEEEYNRAKNRLLNH